MEIKSLNCPNCGTPFPDNFIPNKQFECPSCQSKLMLTDINMGHAMLCPDCGVLNSDEVRYCTGCGKALKVACILCHTANFIDDTNCAHCGANLKTIQLRRKKMLSDRQRVREERNRLLKEKLARQQAEKLERLLDALDEPENHEFAIFQINQMGTEAIDALIDTLLHDDDVDARYGSARALGQICCQHQVKALIKARSAKALVQALSDREAAVRFWAADALAKCGSQIAVAPLAELLEDPHEGVRRRARQSLLQIGGERASEIIAEADRPKGILGWITGS